MGSDDDDEGNDDLEFDVLFTFGQKSFYHAAPEVWNQLPFNLRSCKVLSVFKKLLKTHFFKIAFE